ncbi:MAG: M23 family metallopeptidase [Candidatus Eremiobacteraeota bacterium]|nr:M23 family metallopeptidase [Candidatus Eremiobacteraeota bacterium]
MNDRFYIKIVPHGGDTVLRFRVRRRNVVAGLFVLLVLAMSASTLVGVGVLRARAQVANLRGQAEQQRRVITSIDQQTEALRRELLRVQKQNQAIRQLIGAPAPTPMPAQKTSWHRSSSLQTVAARVRALRAASASTLAEAAELRRMALHVLNLAHLRTLARARLIAAIPSIDPVEGAEIIGCYCYRTYPDAEFHEGVDLGADYGDTVRAAAAGVVAANDYDGTYGIKVDLDHGNGYHTWYAHLSRADVSVGERVYKGQTIGAVGATGFATGPHLHYQIMYDGQPIDPTPFLHGVPANVLAALP